MKEQPDRLERELKEMLSVNPSADLQARIRARAFSTPTRRVPWFAWTSGVAAATAAVFLVAIYHQPNVPEAPPSPPAIVVKAEIPQPAAITEAPIQIRQTRKVQKQVKSTNEATAVLATASTAGVPLQGAEIELPTLKGLELKNSIQPIPLPVPFSIASLQPVKIEPPILTVPNLE
jgi:hypothetical protein